ncbi:Protein of unknown function [Bacillus wiedmannii]|nr:Protein of unknown function [Bacillus wiedmannii]
MSGASLLMISPQIAG